MRKLPTFYGYAVQILLPVRAELEILSLMVMAEINL
jgi:hypothetical protein